MNKAENEAHIKFQEARKDVEQGRSEVLSALKAIDSRLHLASSAARQTLDYLQKTEQVARQFPFVNAAVFVTAGFIFGSWIATEKAMPEIKHPDPSVK